MASQDVDFAAAPSFAMENKPDVPIEMWFGMGGMVLIMLIFLVLYLGLVIWSMIWVAQDAELRGKSGILLAVLVFFTWPLGLLVWVVARPELRFVRRPLPPPPPLPRY